LNPAVAASTEHNEKNSIRVSVTSLGKFCPLGYFLLNPFTPKQAVSIHGLFKGLKISLMWKFWAFKLSFDVDILVFLPLFPKIR
jgi:hypothetical protein